MIWKIIKGLVLLPGLFALMSYIGCILLDRYGSDSPFMTPVSVALICTGSILCFTLLISFLSVYLRRTWCRVAGCCLLFYIGSCSYFYDGFEKSTESCVGNCARVFLSISTTLAEFFPSRGGYQPTNSPYLIGFYLCCSVFCISILLSIFGRKLTNKWHLLLTKLSWRKRRIFWCKVPGSKEELLADSILNKFPDAKCIFSVRESEIQNIPMLLDNFNFKNILLRFRKPGQFHADTLKAPVHFFLTDDCSWNIGMASEVWARIKKSSGLKKVDFYIRITGGVKNYWATQWADNIQSANDPEKPEIEIHLVQESEVIAREFVRKNPLLTAPGIEIIPDSGKVKGSFNILLIGFSDLGEALLSGSVCDGQFLHTDASDTFSVDIVDCNPGKFGLFAARCSEALERYKISFYEKDVYSGDFYKFIKEKLALYNRIIISFNDSTLTMDCAAQIVEIAKINELDMQSFRQKLFVNIPESQPTVNGGCFSELTVFGSLKECYCYDTIINETLDKNARKINFSYCRRSGIADNWNKTDLFTKDSNRSSAAGLYNLCRLMGINDPEKNFAPQAVEKMLSLGLLDIYAETEHLRWSAFMLMRGIHKWDVLNIPGRLDRANDIKTHLRHAALVEFAKLDAVDEKISDRENPDGSITASRLKDHDRGIIIAILSDVFGE